MADLMLANYSIEKFQTKKKNRENNLEDPIKNIAVVASSAIIFPYLVYCALGFIAAFLSWECNTAAGLSVAEKVLWALLAYIFTVPFLIYYILIRSHQCIPLLEEYRKKNKK